jgi:hypothetical protein
MPQRTQDSQPWKRSHTVPAEYANHPLVNRRLFFTLPKDLLECLTGAIGPDRFGAEVWNMELAMTQACGDDDGVGFWAGNRIQFPLLRYQSLEIDPSIAKSLGWTNQQLEAVNTVGRTRSEHFANTARGYAGWLLTNPAFLTEHDSIIQAWQADIDKFHIPIMGNVVNDASLVVGARSQLETPMARFARAFEAFFVRWRLEGLPAPYLPSPLRPQMPVAVLRSVLGHMREGGQTFYMPDTFPVPTRDELRDLMEDALRAPGTPEHMAEWVAFVRAGNSAKSTIQRYARLFELQHYIRVVYQRHAEALHRQKSWVIQAFASFLDVSDDTIEKDLAFVADRLGDDWFLTASLLTNP